MKKIILFVFSFVCFCLAFGQKIEPQFPQKGAAVAYYLWEEDSSGTINQTCFYLPFTQNYFVTPKRKSPSSKNGKILAATIQKVLEAPNKKRRIKSIIPPDTLFKQSQRITWKKEQANSLFSATWRFKNGAWQIGKEQAVLYFEIDMTGALRFAKSDSTIQLENRIPIPANSHFFIYTYLDNQGKITQQRIFQFNGTEVTEQFQQEIQRRAQRYLIFINGYRGPFSENDPTDNVLLRKDFTNYWYHLDLEFDSILKRDARFYLDGSMSLKTSNHKTRLRFGWSYSRTRLSVDRARKAKRYHYLNTNVNVRGFEKRKTEGRLAAISYLAMTQQTASTPLVMDTIDLVSHSMGYAYSLGFLEAIQGKVVLGNYYIIAPESGCHEGYEWNQFEGVWQFGCNLDQADPDPVWLQDGIAPQCAVKDLNLLPSTKGGRFFLPSEGIKKTFIDAHMTYSYHWIIQVLNKASQIPPPK